MSCIAQLQWVRLSKVRLRCPGTPAALVAILTLIALPLCPANAARAVPAKPRPPARLATPGPGASDPAPSNVSPELNATDLEAFLDGLVSAQITHDDIAGVVILVVKDGKILFAKGYGYADVEKKKPISPKDALFRPGSISKLFIWTAVMQLVEQGKLDLDRDVNEYLEFKIPATHTKPITLRHILTHTPGFEESVKDLFVPPGSTLEPLSAYLASHIPRRMLPPGVTPAYSNYGTSLAGHIVQRVSGMPLEDYLEKNIFHPLGMIHSTFRQPLPEHMKPLMSQGYKRASDGAKSFEMVQSWPAGSLSASAEDMARFMIAHLQNGRYGNITILQAGTARMMHARQFGLHDAEPAMALGFYEESSHGHRIIGHGGDTSYFHSDLHLVLDAGVGFFISYNSAGRGETGGRTQIWRMILDRYFTHIPPVPAAVPTAEVDASAVSGNYIVSRRSDDSIFHLGALIAQLAVSAHKDGQIELSLLKGPNGKPKRWQPIAPMVYREIDGHLQVAFRKDDAGQMELIPFFPFMTFRRASLLEHQRFIISVLAASLGVFLLTVLSWPVAALVRRHYQKKLDLSSLDRRLRLLMRLVCVLNLAVAAGWLGFIAHGLSNIGNFNSRLDLVVYVLSVFSGLSAVASFLAVYNVFRAWSDRARWWGTKIHDTALVLACVSFAWLLLKFNFLRFSSLY